MDPREPLGASALAREIAAGRISAREVVETHIARIEAVNPALNAVVVTRFDQARAEADRADAALRAGASCGPLHGVPITIKEHFSLAGTPATLGVPGAPLAEGDGPLVARLRAAGAIVLGKTNVPQLLLYNETDNPVYGRTNNPWNPDRSPGGSSGGEAAIIAACGSSLGLGSDIGGSLRAPAHACGIVALKPTTGRLTNEDARPSGFGFGQLAIVSQPGPLARNVEDLTLAMRVLAAPGLERDDPSLAPVPWREPAQVDPAGLSIALYDDDGFFPASAAVRRAVHEAGEALAARGARVERFAPPGVRSAIALFFGILSADGGRGARARLGSGPRDPRITGLLQLVSVPNVLRPPLAMTARAFGQRRLAEQLTAIRRRDVAASWALAEAQAEYRRAFTAALDAGGFDAIVCPPLAVPALTHGSSYFLSTAASYGMLFNLLGMPAGVVRATRVRPGEEQPRKVGGDVVERTARDVELGSGGLPIGVQVAARAWREDIVLAVMEALESAFRERPEYPRLPPNASAG